MAATRTHFFSSPYGFTQKGLDEFVDRFKYGFEVPESAPFVLYDPKDNLFSLSLDRHDTTTSPYFLAQLRYFTKQHIEHPDVIDPRIRQLNNVVAHKSHDQSAGPDPALLELYDEDDGSDSDSEDALQAMQHMTTYWYPTDGDIKILTTAVAESVASLTGCSLFPESHANRVRLVNGDFTRALAKLQNLEPLLMLLHQQKAFKTPKANANVLLHTFDEPNPSVRFLPVADYLQPAFHRIMVGIQGAPYLDQKFVCQTFLYEDTGIEQFRRVPDNLRTGGVQSTLRKGGCAVWSSYTYKSIGEEANKEPKPFSEVASGRQSEVSLANSRLGTNPYIEPSKAAQVKAWSGQVDESADPTMPCSAPPSEPTTARRRIVAPDSDSDDEVDKEDADIQQDAARDETNSEPLRDLQPRTAVPRSKRDKTYDLISLSSATSGVAVPSAQRSLVASGMSVFQQGILGHDLLEASTVASNLISFQSSTSPAPGSAAQSVHPNSTGSRPISDMPSGALDFEPQGDTNSSSPPRGVRQSRRDSNSSKIEEGPDPQLVQDEECRNDTAITAYTGPGPFASHHFSSDEWEVVGSSQHKKRNINTLDGARSDKTSHDSRNESLSTPPLPQTATDNDGMLRRFDPTAYGLPSQHSRSSRPDNRGRGSGMLPRRTFHSASNYARASNGRQTVRQSGSRFRGRGNRASTVRDRLIDIDHNSVQSPGPVEPPPGLEIQIPEPPIIKEDIATVRSPEAPNLIDEPFEEPVKQEGSRLPLRNQSDLAAFPQGPRSHFSGTQRSFISHSDYSQWVESKEYENHLPPRTNMKARNEAALQTLLATQRSPRLSRIRGGEGSAARKSVNPSDQHLHSTMNQKAGNPGKKKSKKGQTETAEQIRLRKQKALQDAYGEPVNPSAPPKPTPQNDDIGEMSKAKKKLLNTNVNMALSNAEKLRQVVRMQAAEQTVNSLRPIFEASRAFNGELQFEIQFGQAMITSNGQITIDKAIKNKGWEKLFGLAVNANGPVTSFTNMLTSNGADIDRALEIKAETGPPSKLWDKSNPGPAKLTYEFHCQSKQGIDFWLIVDEDGDYHIRNATATIGMTVIHFPDQVWDAAAVLQGQESWTDPPASISEAVADFVGSFYVLPDRCRLALIFRQPKSLEIAVRNVVMRRVSLHQCRLVDHEDLQLQATEIKTLSTKTHPSDKRLWQAFEEDHDKMATDGCVIYELSIIDQAIKSILRQNNSLEVGELTPATSTGKSILKVESMLTLLNVTTYMLTKLDWIGADNIGTLKRKMVADQAQNLRQQLSMPPTARSRMHQPVLPASKATTSRYGGGSVLPDGSDTMVGMTRIPGTRAGTLAPVYESAEGDRYAVGMGGAIVPIADNQQMMLSGGLGTIGEEVGPDDSASQYGMPKTAGQRGIGATSSRSFQRDGRGAGYW